MQHVKKLTSALVVAAALALVAAGPARAEEKVLGTVTDIEMTKPDLAVATLQDRASGQPIALTVTDKLTLDKFQDKRINVGDEIKARYEKKDGKNLVTFFKKPGGC
ncbi:hypothetical protein [Anaeromyxobacter diazotrophicus]|uniref:DUF5666 domain-containing protein n=1 Tax=Anaeromyxobacter diazotrophicus TaxID=2590199 RepID=A0A7I9VIQ3_9BACT|nr:hypothetical protein [Anaeromyxobacter diazotrophicus]GEJ56020.1 hypothetical protein AMYX_07610 [Anaeromyxobacter diazotrophicus]